MLVAAATAFAVVFGLFVVAALVLVVLVLRFTLRRSAASRAAWLSGQGADQEPGPEEEVEEEDVEDPPMTALVLAGGGTRGAVQIGMLQVLTEHGFRPDR